MGSTDTTKWTQGVLMDPMVLRISAYPAPMMVTNKTIHVSTSSVFLYGCSTLGTLVRFARACPTLVDFLLSLTTRLAVMPFDVTGEAQVFGTMSTSYLLGTLSTLNDLTTVSIWAKTFVLTAAHFVVKH